MADTDVKALLLQIDASVELLKKNLQSGDAQVAAFERQTKAKLTSIELAFDKMGAAVGASARSFETLRAGLSAIGLVLPALAIGELAKKGLEFAASIAEQAKQAGVSAERLQELRYAATQTGVSQEGLQTTLIRLGQNLGKAELGSSKLQKAFLAIGITQAELKNHTATVDEAFSKLADKMHELGPSAQAAGLAATVVGRSWAESAPLLYAGSQQIGELTKAAHDLGIVLSNDQIQHAEETAHKLKELELVLSANIAGVVSENARAIYQLANSFTQLAGALAKWWSTHPREAMSLLAGGAAAAVTKNPYIAIAAGVAGYALTPENEDSDIRKANFVRHQMQSYFRSNYGDYTKMSADQVNSIAARDFNLTMLNRRYNSFITDARNKHQPGVAAPADAAGGDGANLPDFLGGAGKKHHDDTLERLRAAEEESYNLSKRELEEKKQILQATEKLTIDTEDRNNLALQAIDVDHDQKALEIQHNLRMIELDKHLDDAKKQQAETEAQKQLALNDQLTVLRRQEVNQQAELERQRQYEQTEQAVVAAKTSRLQLEQGLAQTMAERRTIELQILEIEYEERKRALQRIQNDTVPAYDAQGKIVGTKPAHTQDEINRARIDEASLDRNHPLQVQQTLLNTSGPMEQFLRSIPDTAAKATEALQNVEVQGLQSISQGIVDVITGTKSLGAAFHDIANQIIADLLRIALEKEIIGPLANMLFGGGGGFMAGFNATDASIFSTFGGFAAGGDPPVGRVSMVGEKGPELFIPKVPGTIIPNHMLGRGGGAAAPQIIYVAVDKSDLFDVHVQSSAAQVVGGAAPAIVAAAHRQVMKSLGRVGING